MTPLLILAPLGVFAVTAALGGPWIHALHAIGMVKIPRQKASDGTDAPITRSLQTDRQVDPRGTPTMGGVLPLAVVGLLFAGIAALVPGLRSELASEVAFPLGVIALYAAVGVWDDRLACRPAGGSGSGASMKVIFWLLLAIAGLVAAWAFWMLDVHAVNLGPLGVVELGLIALPVIAVIDSFTVNAVRITDGVDGLMPGLMTIALFALGLISVAHGAPLAGLLCLTLAAGSAGFLWHNAPPAGMYLGATGAALGGALVTIAITVNALSVLPLLAGIFWLEGGSSLVQLLAKKFLGRKVFPATPIHITILHLGLSREKLVMRAWLLGAALATLAVVLA